MKTVYVNFFNGNYGIGSYNGKHYAYKTNIDLKKEDLAVVKVKDEYKVVKVLATSETVDDQATAYIICKVNLEDYEKMVETENRKLELVAQMKKLAETSSILKTFEVLAQSDSNMKALLDEYKALC